jgi:hypothetical protein
VNTLLITAIHIGTMIMISMLMRDNWKKNNLNSVLESRIGRLMLSLKSSHRESQMFTQRIKALEANNLAYIQLLANLGINPFDRDNIEALTKSNDLH